MAEREPWNAKEAVTKILEDYQLEATFPDPVAAEVRTLVEDPEIDDPALLDLTDLAFVTIDHESSRDLDQAVFVTAIEDGYRVDYALADAAHYCRPGMAMFGEALRRGASFYLPDMMVPMLPRELSEGIVSLNEQVDRRALVFRMTIDAAGNCVRTDFVNARVRSRHKLSFERAQAYLDDPEGAAFDDPAVGESLRALEKVGQLRIRHAEERNVVRYRRAEVSVRLSKGAGMRFVVGSDLRIAIERYNEQISLLCNMEGARFLREHAGSAASRVQAIYRVHPPPEPDRIAELQATLEALAQSHGLDRQRWTWNADEESLAEYLDRLPEAPETSRLVRAIHRQAILVNGRSSFRAEPGIHFGVGADVYARFSAPMREIVGIYLHKEMREALGTSGAKAPADADEVLRESIVTAANRSKDVQRDITNAANRLILDQLFLDDLDRSEKERERAGTLMGIRMPKVYVLLDDPAIDVKVYLPGLSKLTGETFEPDGPVLRGDRGTALRIGDPVVITVVDRDKRDRWRLRIRRP
ncbi:MAG: RNB domain-containing ribonuclease [Myxococcota bacterium]